MSSSRNTQKETNIFFLFNRIKWNEHSILAQAYLNFNYQVRPSWLIHCGDQCGWMHSQNFCVLFYYTCGFCKFSFLPSKNFISEVVYLTSNSRLKEHCSSMLRDFCNLNCNIRYCESLSHLSLSFNMIMFAH